MSRGIMNKTFTYVFSGFNVWIVLTCIVSVITLAGFYLLKGGGAGAADSWSTHFTVRFCSVLIIMADAEDMSGMDFRRNSGCLL